MSNKRRLRKIRILIIMLMLFGVTGYGQEEDPKILVKAILIDQNDDSIAAKVLYINVYNLQFSIAITDSKGNVLKYFAPTDLKGFILYAKYDTARFYSMPSPIDGKLLFIQVMHESRYSLYQYVKADAVSSRPLYRTIYYLWKNGWLDPPITQETSKESMLAHFSSCLELKYKIMKGEYKLQDIKKIINEYESCELIDNYDFLYE